MKITIADFNKDKEFLVCVDSDGCAMDTMEVKHRKCFAPKAIEVWGLQHIENKFLEVWNNVNLYSKTRGINRFKGLVRTFELLKEEGISMPEFSSIKQWTETTLELSNPALQKAIEETNDEQLIKTMEWSKEVNKAISELHNEDKPFTGVKEALESISKVVDIAIVSSANGGAVIDEWTRHGLAVSVKVMLGQEAGTKAACISGLKERNFPNDKVLMVGDAPGDLDAALKNGVLYYPILVGKEELSWKRLATEAMSKFLDGSYSGEYQQTLIEEFNQSLK
ncbi:HAD family hydrolase [Clostridium folliculivorans]|uniref:Phosphatase n=1 Tax=Clostridium folliculivorans TaxID=2886038 RepID=A0A9W6DC42_9CLOT|nr:HAD hydrolase-like protein [Clostridium folliculivorans]GKU26597.1 phosphatase [Clostridium folliculivorans]GKU28971.1 phosphatase [Clostridium folliculivorans]